ncbi:MAG: hypothetical protein GY906_36935 [bacterium]|nr:hypothetical protein [bacterium]
MNIPKPKFSIRDEFLSRKFIGTLITQLMAFYGLMKDKISDDVFQVIMIAALAIFAGANVWEKIKLNGQNNDA